MNTRKSLLTVALLAGMGASGVAWAGSVCQLDTGPAYDKTNPDDSLSTACGPGDYAEGSTSFAFGNADIAQGDYSSAFGYANKAMGLNSNAFGGGLVIHAVMWNRATGVESNAFGLANLAQGDYSSAFGALATTGTGADYSIAFGTGSVPVSAENYDGASTRTDSAQVADNVTSAIAIGHTVSVNADDGVAMGHDSAVNAGATGAVALGSDAIAGDANTLSVGHAAADTNPATGKAYDSALNRRIVHVAAGDIRSTSTDAVNGGQLYATNQQVSANTSGIADNKTAIGTNVTDITTLDNTAVFYADAAHTRVLFGMAGTPVVLSNVAAGTAPTDAVNKSQLDAVTTQVGQVAANAVIYDGAGKASITLSGQNGTALGNVKAGTLSAVSMDAINGSQLYVTNQNVATNAGHIADNTAAINQNTTDIHQLDNRVTTVEGQVNQLQQSTATLTYMAVDGKGDGSDAASVKAGSRGVAIGSSATAGGDHGTAVGGDSFAAGSNDTALGGNAIVDADGSTAVGANTHIVAAATNAVAVGEGSAVNAASGTAVGQGAKVAANNAVALGHGSVADQADTVSVGSTGHTRRVTNVAAGKASTDAVNKGQLDAVTQQAVVAAKTYAQAGDKTTLRQANAYTDQQIRSALGGNIARFRQSVDERFYQVDRRMDRMNAMRSASTQMAINAADAQGSGRLAVGLGFSSGKSALSVGYGTPLGSRFHVSFGATASGSQTSAGVGFGVSL